MIEEKKKKKRWTGRALIASAFLVAAAAAFILTLPSLLIAQASEAKSDVILYGAVSSNSIGDKYVIDLYRRGLGRKIVCASSQVSRELYPSDYMRESLIAQGLPAEDVISMRLPIAPCDGAKLVKILELVKANGWKSLLYVAQPEESRYLNILARKYFEREGVALAVSYSPEDMRELTRNWSGAHSKMQRITGEVMTITLDRFYSECR